MSDIFISYASEDREWVVSLADVLRQQGWTVWWDRSIPFGQSFQTVIENALNDARCVIVVWSRHSVNSGWVSAEADEARNRGILVPLLIDNVSPPLVFRQLQTANLTDWDGDTSVPVFRKLNADIAALLGTPVITSRFSEHARKKTGSKRRNLTLFSLLIAVAVMAGVWFSGVFKPVFMSEPEKTGTGQGPIISEVIKATDQDTQAEQETAEPPASEQLAQENLYIAMFRDAINENRLDMAEHYLEKARINGADAAVLDISQQQLSALRQEDQQRLETEQRARAEAQRQQDEADRVEQRRLQAEQLKREEASRQLVLEQQRQAEEQRLAEEKLALAEAQRKKEQADRAEQARLQADQAKQDEETRQLALAEQRRADQAAARLKQQQAEEQSRREAVQRQAQLEEERLRKEQEMRQAEQAEQTRLEQERQRLAKLEQQKAATLPPLIDVQVTGMGKQFERYGLSEAALRSMVKQRLTAAGFNVDSSAASDTFNMLLAFKFIENTIAGFYSYSASIKIKSDRDNTEFWSQGENGTARSVELKKVNDVFIRTLDKFIQDYPDKGRELRR